MRCVTRVFAAAVLVIAPCVLLGQSAAVPYGPDTGDPGQTFSSQLLSHLYSGNYSSIRKVNFRDFRLLDFDKSGKPVEGFSLQNGHYQHDKPGDHQTIDLEAVHYLTNADSRTGESALLLLSWFAAGGSSSQGGKADIFSVSSGRLQIIQEIDWETHSLGKQPAESFDTQTNNLVIRADHYVPGDAHCCISAVDVVTFHWDGTHFVQVDLHTELSEHGSIFQQIRHGVPANQLALV